MTTYLWWHTQRHPSVSLGQHLLQPGVNIQHQHAAVLDSTRTDPLTGLPSPPITPITPQHSMQHRQSIRPAQSRRISSNSRTPSCTTSVPATLLTREPLPSPPPSSERRTTLDDDPNEVWGYFGEWRGRKMRMPGPLPWPCDSLEAERVEAQHWLLRLMLGMPFIGPADEALRRAGNKARVLDIATGVGVWAMDMAELFPWVEVVGCDNAPIQEIDAWSNIEWDLVDLDDLPYEEESFDVVHLRFAQLRVRSYSNILRTAFNLVRPGGVLLIFDAASPPMLHDGRSTTGTQAWTDAFHRSLKHAGLKPFTVDEVIKVFRNETITGSDMRVPIGHGQGRMGQLGKIHVVNTKAYLEVGRYVMTEHGGYTNAEVDVLTAAYLQDVREHALYTKYHAFSVCKAA